jgi:predicted RND superfamily exporter protein
MVLPSDIRAAGLDKVLNHYTAEKNRKILLSTYVYLPPGDYLSEKKALLDQLKEEKMFKEGVVKYSTEESVINEIRHLVVEEIAWLGLLALILTIFLLWWGTRSLKKTVLTLIPLLLGGASAMGAYAIFAGPFSIFNLMLVPIYIGMATDDALHLGEELSEPGEGEPISRALRKWGGMIILTSVTNMIGFGSNLFTQIEVLRRIGVWIMLALGCELIGSILMLPALFKIFLKREEPSLRNEWEFGTGFAAKLSKEN